MIACVVHSEKESEIWIADESTVTINKHGHKRTWNSTVRHTNHNLEIKKRRKDISPCSCVGVLCCFFSLFQRQTLLSASNFHSCIWIWILKLNCTSWEPFSADQHTPAPQIFDGRTLPPLFTSLIVVIMEASQLLPSPCQCSHLSRWQGCHIFFLHVGRQTASEVRAKLTPPVTVTIDDDVPNPEGGNCATNEFEKCTKFNVPASFILCTQQPLDVNIMNQSLGQVCNCLVTPITWQRLVRLALRCVAEEVPASIRTGKKGGWRAPLNVPGPAVWLIYWNFLQGSLTKKETRIQCAAVVWKMSCWWQGSEVSTDRVFGDHRKADRPSHQAGL